MTAALVNRIRIPLQSGLAYSLDQTHTANSTIHPLSPTLIGEKKSEKTNDIRMPHNNDVHTLTCCALTARQSSLL